MITVNINELSLNLTIGIQVASGVASTVMMQDLNSYRQKPIGSSRGLRAEVLTPTCSGKLHIMAVTRTPLFISGVEISEIRHRLREAPTQ